MARMSVVIRLKVPIEMHYTVIPMGTSKVNSSPGRLHASFSMTPTAANFYNSTQIIIRKNFRIMHSQAKFSTYSS